MRGEVQLGQYFTWVLIIVDGALAVGIARVLRRARVLVLLARVVLRLLHVAIVLLGLTVFAFGVLPFTIVIRVLLLAVAIVLVVFVLCVLPVTIAIRVVLVVLALVIVVPLGLLVALIGLGWLALLVVLLFTWRLRLTIFAGTAARKPNWFENARKVVQDRHGLLLASGLRRSRAHALSSSSRRHL